MKRIRKCESKRCWRGALLSLLCAGVVALFITGCAEAPYVTSNTANGPRYRIIDGQRVYEPYYYGAYATVGVPAE